MGGPVVRLPMPRECVASALVIGVDLKFMDQGWNL